jgi:hypothetical protein
MPPICPRDPAHESGSTTAWRLHRLVGALCRQRNLVEVLFHSLNRFRAIATRQERNYVALLQVAYTFVSG